MFELFCSGQEPVALRKLTGATIDNDCELIFGVDFMWFTPLGVAGVQRKRFDDLIQSYREDDRMAKEIKQFEGLKFCFLVIELQDHMNGKMPWGSNQEYVGGYQGKGGISRVELMSFIESLDWIRGIRTRWSSSLTDTAEIVKILHKWTIKTSHSGVIPARTPPNREELKRIKAKGWTDWILTGFPGLGPSTAKAILKACPEPLRWAEELDLNAVPGIGPLRSKSFREALRCRD